MQSIFAAQSEIDDAKYRHWEEIRHRKAPAGLSSEEWWLLLKLQRQSQYKGAPFNDTAGSTFRYTLVPPIPERLHEIDLSAGGRIQMTEPITNPDTRDQYCVSSLMEEAITSSQIEGAATTREVAKKMLRTGRKPQDHSERMILNNFLTMRHIQRIKAEPLTPELIFDIHRLVTDQTLDNPECSGRLRTADERVEIIDAYNEVLHTPPQAEQLKDRMKAMCEFANADTPWVHPAVRAIILHFWLAYDHPFVDGNGRTARALFYWSMLRRGYWLFEFISISQVIRKALIQYGRAFLYTETDDNDLTYFILYHLDVIDKAVDELHRHIEQRTKELRKIERELIGIGVLNHRQRELVRHALRHGTTEYTIEAHQTSHQVAYDTARKDLLDLVDRDLFDSFKRGRTWHFRPKPDIEDRLRKLT